MKTIRVIRWLVQPVVVVDDGDTLTDVEVQPLTIPHAAWPEFAVTGWPEAIAQLQQQVDES